jgi:hypothetical protein
VQAPRRLTDPDPPGSGMRGQRLLGRQQQAHPDPLTRPQPPQPAQPPVGPPGNAAGQPAQPAG